MEFSLAFESVVVLGGFLTTACFLGSVGPHHRRKGISLLLCSSPSVSKFTARCKFLDQETVSSENNCTFSA